MQFRFKVLSRYHPISKAYPRIYSSKKSWLQDLPRFLARIHSWVISTVINLILKSRRTKFEPMMSPPGCFRHLKRVLCLLFTLYILSIECDFGFDDYACWRRMFIEDSFCSDPCILYNSKNEFSERKKWGKLVLKQVWV